jgi:hypothetical protein
VHVEVCSVVDQVRQSAGGVGFRAHYRTTSDGLTFNVLNARRKKTRAASPSRRFETSTPPAHSLRRRCFRVRPDRTGSPERITLPSAKIEYARRPVCTTPEG